MVQLWTKLTTVNCSLSDVEEAKSPRTQYGYSVVYFLNHLGFSCFWRFLKCSISNCLTFGDFTRQMRGRDVFMEKILTKFSISSFEYDYNKQRWAIIIKIVNPCILRSKFYRKSKSRFIFFTVLTSQSDIGMTCSVKWSFVRIRPFKNKRP